MNGYRRNFSLIELLVVVAVIALLVGIVLPALNKAKIKGYEACCLANMKQIGAALNSYSVDCAGVYPYAESVCSWDSGNGWMNHLSMNEANRASEKKIYRCPRETRRDFSYSLNCVEIFKKTGSFGSWRTADFDKAKTAPSQMVFVEESDPSKFEVDNCDQDNYNNDVTCVDLGHHGSFTLLFVDGHALPVRFIDTTRMSYFTDIMSEWY